MDRAHSLCPSMGKINTEGRNQAEENREINAEA